jgi:nicotinamidase-related amidase
MKVSNIKLKDNLNDIVFMCCDVQRNLTKLIPNREELIKSVSVLLQSSVFLNIPVIATEHDPETWGETDQDIINLFHTDVYLYIKTSFSMLNDKVLSKLNELNRKTVVLFGLTTHVCILNTCIDLISRGFNVFVVWDGVSSPRKENHKVALERIKSIGVMQTTTESCLYEILGSSKDERFDKIHKVLTKLNN